MEGSVEGHGHVACVGADGVVDGQCGGFGGGCRGW